MGWGCASPTSPQHRAQPFPTNSSGAIPRAGAPLEILCWLVRGLSPCCLSPPLLLGACWCRSIPGVPEVPGLSSSCLPCHFPQLQPLFLAPAEAASRQPGRREGAGKHAWYFPPKKNSSSAIFSAGFAVCPSAHPGSSPFQAPLALPASPPKCSAPRARIRAGGHPGELWGRGASGAPQPLPPAPHKSTSELWLSSSPHPAGFPSCFGGCCWNIKAGSGGQSLPRASQSEVGAAKGAPELAPGLASSLVLSGAFAGEQNAARRAQGAPQPLV